VSGGAVAVAVAFAFAGLCCPVLVVGRKTAAQRSNSRQSKYVFASRYLVGRVREGRVRHGRVDVGVGAMVVARGGQRGEQFCGPWSTSAAAEPVGEQYAPLGRVVQAALGARYDRVLQLRLELRLIGRRKGAHGDVGVSVSVVVVVVVLWTARVCRSGACACVCVFVVSWFRVFL
jgi:hypothetical protein